MQGEKLKVPDLPEDVPQLSSLSGVEDSSEGELPSWDSSDDGMLLSPSQAPVADEQAAEGALTIRSKYISGISQGTLFLMQVISSL